MYELPSNNMTLRFFALHSKRGEHAKSKDQADKNNQNHT